MHAVTEREWQELLGRVKALEAEVEALRSGSLQPTNTGTTSAPLVETCKPDGSCTFAPTMKAPER